MNIKNTFIVMWLLTATVTFAQDATPVAAPWNHDLQTGINLNQSSYSDNWKAGGVNSVAVSAFLNGKLNFKSEKSDWTNDLQLQYGNVRNQGQGMRKNADRIFFESKYGYRINDKWNAFASANFLTQFDAGFQYSTVDGSERSLRISDFMAPGYLTEAIGFEYKPVSYFSAQLGLGGLRHTFVLDQTLYDKYDVADPKYNLLYGVERGANIRTQAVFQFVGNFDKEIMKNVVLKARYQALLDYGNLTSQGIVHRLDASLVAKVNKFVQVNLTTVVLYDYDQDVNIQYSQVLALGILYRLTNMSN
jgi:hypothetical protein